MYLTSISMLFAALCHHPIKIMMMMMMTTTMLSQDSLQHT